MGKLRIKQRIGQTQSLPLKSMPLESGTERLDIGNGVLGGRLACAKVLRCKQHVAGGELLQQISARGA